MITTRNIALASTSRRRRNQCSWKDFYNGLVLVSSFISLLSIFFSVGSSVFQEHAPQDVVSMHVTKSHMLERYKAMKQRRGPPKTYFKQDSRVLPVGRMRAPSAWAKDGRVSLGPTFPNYTAPFNKIEFVHITKTGGTAAEMIAAKEANITWGLCHFQFKMDFGPACLRPNWAHQIQMFSVRPPWHSPPHWMNPNPYKDSNTFTIIRNPYDRIVSEYYCKYYGFHSRQYFEAQNLEAARMSRLLNVTQPKWSRPQKKNLLKESMREIPFRQQCKEDMVAWEEVHPMEALEKEQLVELDYDLGFVNMALPSCRKLKLHTSRSDQRRANRQRPKGRSRLDSPYVFNNWIRQKLTTRDDSVGHLLPQHHYIYDRNGMQVIDHVLRYENISSAFDDLMKQYGISLTWSEKTEINEGHESKGKERLTVRHLDQNSLDLINEVYKDDFILLRYPEIKTSMLTEAI